MNWRCGSSSRAPALQVQKPKFKPQTNKKKKLLINFMILLNILYDIRILRFFLDFYKIDRQLHFTDVY
jgi:hypothetical protein